MSAPDFDLLAASLRADTSDLRVFVEALATKLEDAFPTNTRVERKGGLFGGGKRVQRVDVELGGDRFELEHRDGRVAARRRQVVRGIALKTEEMRVDEFLSEVGDALEAEVSRSGKARAALAAFLGLS